MGFDLDTSVDVTGYYSWVFITFSSKNKIFIIWTSTFYCYFKDFFLVCDFFSFTSFTFIFFIKAFTFSFTCPTMLLTMLIHPWSNLNHFFYHSSSFTCFTGNYIFTPVPITAVTQLFSLMIYFKHFPVICIFKSYFYRE